MRSRHDRRAARARHRGVAGGGALPAPVRAPDDASLVRVRRRAGRRSRWASRSRRLRPPRAIAPAPSGAHGSEDHEDLRAEIASLREELASLRAAEPGRSTRPDDLEPRLARLEAELSSRPAGSASAPAAVGRPRRHPRPRVRARVPPLRRRADDAGRCSPRRRAEQRAASGRTRLTRSLARRAATRAPRCARRLRPHLRVTHPDFIFRSRLDADERAPHEAHLPLPRHQPRGPAGAEHRAPAARRGPHPRPAGDRPRPPRAADLRRGLRHGRQLHLAAAVEVDGQARDRRARDQPARERRGGLADADRLPSGAGRGHRHARGRDLRIRRAERLRHRRAPRRGAGRGQHRACCARCARTRSRRCSATRSATSRTATW